MYIQNIKLEEEIFVVIEKDKYFFFNDELYITKEMMDHILERINLEIKICFEQ